MQNITSVKDSSQTESEVESSRNIELNSEVSLTKAPTLIIGCMDSVNNVNSKNETYNMMHEGVNKVINS